MTDKNHDPRIPIEDIGRLRRLEAEVFRLKNELAHLTQKYEETFAHLQKIRVEASDAARLNQKAAQAASKCLHESRAQNLALETALKTKNAEVIRLRKLNQSLLGITEFEQRLSRRYTDLGTSIQTEVALQHDRESWLRDHAPETAPLADGASFTEDGAVSGISLAGREDLDSGSA